MTTIKIIAILITLLAGSTASLGQLLPFKGMYLGMSRESIDSLVHNSKWEYAFGQPGNQGTRVFLVSETNRNVKVADSGSVKPRIMVASSREDRPSSTATLFVADDSVSSFSLESRKFNLNGGYAVGEGAVKWLKECEEALKEQYGAPQFKLAETQLEWQMSHMLTVAGYGTIKVMSWNYQTLDDSNQEISLYYQLDEKNNMSSSVVFTKVFIPLKRK